MRDLAAGRMAATERRLRVRLPEEFARRAHGLLVVRLRDIERDPHARPWLLRLIVLRDAASATGDTGGHRRAAVGMVGFHGAPDAQGRAEVGYEVFAPFRRRGYAREAVVGLLDWAARRHGVGRFVAAIAPENEPSMRLALGLGFHQVGAQVDPEGLEFVYELQWPAKGSAISRGRAERRT
jgi:RimJ/RimL family protein N-acetyltransferase